MKICPDCGTKLQDDCLFCFECGMKLTNSVADENRHTTLNDNQDILTKAKYYCVCGRYQKAKEIYEHLIEENIEDINGYMGMIRVVTKNYTEFDGGEIRYYIQLAQQVSKHDDLSKFDLDFDEYNSQLKKYLAERNLCAIRPINKGNYVMFGMWPQRKKYANISIDDNTCENVWYMGRDGEQYAKDGKEYFEVEPIKWHILSKNGNKALMLSEDILFSMTYDDYFRSSNTYSTSYVRRWLNNVFYERAFQASARHFIETTKVDNSAHSTGQSFNFYACHDTDDHIFLLSYEEVFEKYGLTEAFRTKKQTDYAIKQGSIRNCLLRSPCADSAYECWTNDGRISIRLKSGIVPALQINF